MATKPEDVLNDSLLAAATAFCRSRGLRYGIDRIASAMREAAADVAEDIQDEQQKQRELALWA